MLNISKNQVVKGQEVKVDLSNLNDEIWEQKYCKSFFTDRGLNTGDSLFLQDVSSGMVTVLDSKGKTSRFYWSEFKRGTKAVGENLGAEVVEYVIHYEGKKYKQKKFSDIGKVKASFLDMMNYHGIFENKARQHSDTCPENVYAVAEWLGNSYNPLSREDFKKVEVFEWQNRKIGKKANIDPVAFYDEQMFLIEVSSKYGSCVREIFKKINDTHKYIFVFVHEDYKKTNYVYYSDLKESEIIKAALKTSKIKGSLKSTKMGKTAIAVTSASDAATIISNLPEGSKYYTLDIKGNELALQNDWFVLAESRNEKIASIFED